MKPTTFLGAALLLSSALCISFVLTGPASPGTPPDDPVPITITNAPVRGNVALTADPLPIMETPPLAEPQPIELVANYPVSSPDPLARHASDLLSLVDEIRSIQSRAREIADRDPLQNHADRMIRDLELLRRIASEQAPAPLAEDRPLPTRYGTGR